MTPPNLAAAWIGILLGMLSGALMGLRFHEEGWLGGYSTWRRRLLRLGHVSLFGIAFLNLAFDWTWVRSGWSGAPPRAAGIASALLCAGALLMPAVCALSAWRKPLRHLFALPVGCLAGAAVSCLRALGSPIITGGAP